MFEHNKPFEQFRDKLNARGVFLRFMWEACSGIKRRDNSQPPAGVTKRQWGELGTKRPDVAMVSFYGERTAVGTAILVDYGEDGFGVWFEPKTNNIDDAVAAIIGCAPKSASERLRDTLARLEEEAHHLACIHDDLDRLNDLCTEARALLQDVADA